LTSSESLPKVFDAWILKNCAFFFDGFDEVSEKKKTKIASEIVELLNASEDSQFILSSRDEPSLSALTSFSRFEISPLNRSEAEILVRKLAKNSVADALIEKIKESESSIRHFLTNPLLICLLVRAFLHSQILPRHLSEFYRQVFDALYQNHDAGKDLGGYARDKKSNLNLDSMHKVLRSLGILGYLTSALEYRRDALIKEVSAAKKLALAGEFSESEFIDDITRAVPLFVNDVTTIRWSHKSLQEYFAAAYICMDANTKQPDLLRKLSEKENAATHFNILSLVLDMDKKAFRQHVLMPAIDTVLKSSTSLWPDFAEVPDVLIAQRRGVICSNGCLVRLKEPVTRKEVISSTLIINLVSKHFPQRGCAFEMFDSQLGRTFAEDDMVTFIGAVETFEVWLPIFHLSEGARIARAPETGPVPAGMQDLLETLEPGELYVLDRTEEASLNSPALFPIGTEFAKRMTPYLSFDEVQRTAQELSNEQETAAQLISALLS